MQFVAAKDVREGMCVAQDVCDPMGRVLIARGQKVAQHHIVRLRKFEISSIFIDPAHGESVARPARSELRAQCEQALGSAFQQMRQDFAEKRVNLDAATLKAAANTLVDSLMRSKSPMVTLCDIGADSDRLMQHSVNVAVLGISIAIDLQVPEEMLRELAVALLFHDVGMIFLPEEL